MEEDDDDLPPPPHAKVHDEETFAGSLGLTFTGLMWVAAFAVIAGVLLYAIVHWL